ncbi:uncharacterized protein METZ01_LOCUS93477 [marine metagenome]|uniref:Uncharacterized protein n=1 Tax=marine metagenome TaxID=408172 RepID=A0A381VMD1_9ZZZZ
MFPIGKGGVTMGFTYYEGGVVSLQTGNFFVNSSIQKTPPCGISKRFGKISFFISPEPHVIGISVKRFFLARPYDSVHIFFAKN